MLQLRASGRRDQDASKSKQKVQCATRDSILKRAHLGCLRIPNPVGVVEDAYKMSIITRDSFRGGGISGCAKSKHPGKMIR